MANTMKTIDKLEEVLISLGGAYGGINDFDADYVADVKQALSTMVAEIIDKNEGYPIGNMVEVLELNESAERQRIDYENTLRNEQRQRAIDRGFTMGDK